MSFKLSVVSPLYTFTKSSDESSSITTIQLTAPTNQIVKITRLGVFFNEETGNITPASPLLIEIGRSSSASGAGGTAQTPKKRIPSPGSPQTIATVNRTTAATITDILDTYIINPQSWVDGFPPMAEEIILDPTEVLSLNITSGAVLSTGNLGVTSKVWFEE